MSDRDRRCGFVRMECERPKGTEVSFFRFSSFSNGEDACCVGSAGAAVELIREPKLMDMGRALFGPPTTERAR